MVRVGVHRNIRVMPNTVNMNTNKDELSNGAKRVTIKVKEKKNSRQTNKQKKKMDRQKKIRIPQKEFKLATIMK